MVRPNRGLQRRLSLEAPVRVAAVIGLSVYDGLPDRTRWLVRRSWVPDGPAFHGLVPLLGRQLDLILLESAELRAVFQKRGYDVGCVHSLDTLFLLSSDHLHEFPQCWL